MTVVQFIAPYKSHQIGDCVELDSNLAEWLMSRKYAQPTQSLPVAAVTSHQSPVTASKRGKK